MQRLRITFAVDGAMRYPSHLDRMRVWERAARRAGLPLAYSEGYHPRPRLQAASALPVGFAARGELLDLRLTRPVEPGTAQRDVARALPEGLAVLRIEQVDPAEPALSTRVQAAEYRVAVETAEPNGEIGRCIDGLLASGELPRTRRGRAYDLRPLVHELGVVARQTGEVTLRMLLAARAGATGRPEEVLDALGVVDRFFRIRRERLLLAPLMA